MCKYLISHIGNSSLNPSTINQTQSDHKEPSQRSLLDQPGSQKIFQLAPHLQDSANNIDDPNDSEVFSVRQFSSNAR